MQCKHRAQEDLKIFGRETLRGLQRVRSGKYLKGKPGGGVVSLWGAAMIIRPGFRPRE